MSYNPTPSAPRPEEITQDSLDMQRNVNLYSQTPFYTTSNVSIENGVNIKFKVGKNSVQQITFGSHKPPVSQMFPHIPQQPMNSNHMYQTQPQAQCQPEMYTYPEDN